MNGIIHRADSRGIAEHGWLHSRHTFSFASYYNPERMGFGKLRVINDDVVEAGAGFGTHPHDNMEIISIPLAGGLRHRDSMGNEHQIYTGDIQIMSAGTGISHSEYNASDSEPVNFLQIWVLPRLRNITPRYDQKTLDAADRKNRFELVISPHKNADTLWINQDAWFSLGDFDAGQLMHYTTHMAGTGVYVLVLEGEIGINNETLAKRDAIGITGTDEIEFAARQHSRLLVIEVAV